MIVIVHQAVCVTDPVIPSIHVSQRVKKIDAILVVFIYSLLFIAAGSDVINGIGVLDPKGAGHAWGLAEKKGSVIIKDLTL